MMWGRAAGEVAGWAGRREIAFGTRVYKYSPLLYCARHNRDNGMLTTYRYGRW